MQDRELDRDNFESAFHLGPPGSANAGGKPPSFGAACGSATHWPSPVTPQRRTDRSKLTDDSARQTAMHRTPTRPHKWHRVSFPIKFSDICAVAYREAKHQRSPNRGGSK